MWLYAQLAVSKHYEREAKAGARKIVSVEKERDEVSSLHPQVGKDKEAMEEDYQKALELIFAYGYKCCVFKHICGDHSEVLDGMLDSSNLLPLEFFVNPRCLPATAATEATIAEVDQNEAAKEPEKIAFAEDQSRSLSFFFFLPLFFFLKF